MRASIQIKAAVHAATPIVCIFALLLGSVPLAFAQAAAENPAAPDPEAPAAPPANEGTTADPTPIITDKLIPPSLKKDAQPLYPLEAKAQGIGAVVVVDIDIDANGHVEAAVIATGADDPNQGFEQAALEAAKRLIFVPARMGETTVPVRINYRFRFVPDVKTESPTPSEQIVQKPPPAPPQGELWGKLRERGTRLPLVGVKVTVFRGEGDQAIGFETETDKEGAFHLEGLGVGDWRVLADPQGYYPLRITEAVAKGERTDAKYSIEKRSYNPYDVVVETQRVRREVNRTVINARQAERIPGTFGDVLSVVQNFPGVARTVTGQLVVRGSAPEDTKTLVNGVQVPLLYHFGGLRSILPVGMIDAIEFIPGNFSTEYGRATGGIVDVQLKTLAPQKIGGYLDVSILDTSLYLEAPITDELAIAVGARRSYIDYVLEAVLPDDGTSIVAPRYYDYQALASYRPTPEHQLESFFFVSDDIFEIIFEQPPVENPEFVVDNVSFGMNSWRLINEYKYIPSERFQNEFKVSYGHNITALNVGSDLYVNADLTQAQVRNTSRYVLDKTFAVRGGLDYLYQNGEWDIRLPDLPEEGDGGAGGGEPNISLNADDFTFSANKKSFHSTGAFAELEVTPFERTLVIPGVRVDHFTRTGDTGISPRVTARQGLDDEWALKAGVGFFVQEPQFLELDESMGNPDLTLETAVHYSLGVEYQPEDYLDFEVTGFYKTLDSLVSGTDEIIQRDGQLVPKLYDNEGSGRVYGTEVSLKHELAHGFYGWLAYTLSRSERQDSGSDEYRLFDFDQTHILTLIGSYRLPRNWEIGSRFRYVSGNLYTPVTGSIYDVDNDRYRGIPAGTNSDRLDAFHQLDVRIDKRWIYETWILGAYLDIQNVYNQQNPEGMSYNFDFSETDVSVGLPILPVIGLRGEF
ncbi:MAG: TonB-dependent receptor [Polyangiaceae bacterium]|nr:TonB-dependent receptor [Polyangiaceae bacterium]